MVDPLEDELKVVNGLSVVYFHYDVFVGLQLFWQLGCLDSILDLVGLVHSDHDDLVLCFRLLPIDERTLVFVSLVGFDRLDDQDIAAWIQQPGNDLEYDGIIRDIMSDFDFVVVDVKVIVHIINIPKLLYFILGITPIHK